MEIVPQQTGASRFTLAAVLDPRGRPLVDIGADDFVVQESGQPREILSVRVADYPLVLLVDNRAESRDDFPLIQKAASRFVGRLGPRPIAVVTLGGTPSLVASFDDDREAVVERLAALEPATASGPPAPATALAAALTSGVIRAAGPLFSTIVIITKAPIEVEGQLDALVASIVDSRAILHVVANAGVDARPITPLRFLAEQTHGEYTSIYASLSYGPALDRLADRLTTELLVEYLVPVGSRASDVTIGVRLPGSRVRGLGVAPR
jgi:predicted regulator of Ras-like GTPase activity (Roadblock/LC7/MglB family)